MTRPDPDAWLARTLPTLELCRMFHGVGCRNGCAATSVAVRTQHPNSCACDGQGWLWGHELLSPETYTTDTRYPCDRADNYGRSTT